MFFLESPYKWGTGWTLIPEELNRFNEILFVIIKRTGFIKKENIYGVPEGVSEDSFESCYLHPMELVFKLNKDRNIDDIIEVVKEEILKYNQARIMEIKVKDMETEKYTTIE